jgi:hypothetical protein
MSSDLINLIYILGSVPERGMRGALSVHAIDMALDGLLKNKIILNGYNSFQEYYGNAVLEDTANFIGYMGHNIHPKYISFRSSVVDLRYNVDVLLNSNYTTIIPKSNLYDPKGVQEVNELYFKEYPLDLNRL